MAQLVKNLHAVRETWVQSLGWEAPLEKGKSTHSSILAWRIPEWWFNPIFWLVFLYLIDEMKSRTLGLTGGTVGKNLPANAEDKVWSLVWEDPTCHGTTNPVHHNYWSCTLKPERQLLSSHAAATKPTCPRANALQQATAKRRLHTIIKSSPHLLQLEKTHEQQQRYSTTKNK